jgi:hypothetical protein
MSWLQDKIDILIARLAIWSIKRGYGADCETSDLDDLPTDYKVPKDVFKDQRCGSCRAKEVVDWLEKHIKLMKSI